MFLNQRGQKGWEKQIPTAKFRRTRFRFLLPQTRPDWAEQRRNGRIKISDVRRLRSRQVSEISVRSEQRKLPGAQRRDPDCGSPFFWVLFFGEAKNKCLACRGDSRPGNEGQPSQTRNDFDKPNPEP